MTRLSLLRSARRPRPDGAPAGQEAAASPGQILVLFALMSTALFGILGLSIDVGYALSQRRAVQNAADFAAIAGAHTVAEYLPGVHQPRAATSVNEIVSGNKTNGQENGGVPILDECVYVDDSDNEWGGCGLTVPADATGVRVVTSETHDTFFIRVIPGAAQQLTTRARATARVELLFRAGMDSPFLICGYGTKLSDDGDGVYDQTQDILLNDSTVNPEAVGKKFRVVGVNKKDSNHEDDQIADCGLESALWKGYGSAGSGANGPNNDDNLENMEWYGMKSFPAINTQRYTLNGVRGCYGSKDPAPLEAPANASSFSADYEQNCVMTIPVATNSVTPSCPQGPVCRFFVVKVLAFKISKLGTRHYEAQLLDDYPAWGGALPGWTRDSGGTVVIKLQ